MASCGVDSATGAAADTGDCELIVDAALLSCYKRQKSCQPNTLILFNLMSACLFHATVAPACRPVDRAASEARRAVAVVVAAAAATRAAALDGEHLPSAAAVVA